MQKCNSAYGAHFCTNGLMLLSSFFVLSIIVLKGKTKRGSVSMLLLHGRVEHCGYCFCHLLTPCILSKTADRQKVRNSRDAFGGKKHHIFDDILSLKYCRVTRKWCSLHDHCVKVMMLKVKSGLCG